MSDRTLLDLFTKTLRCGNTAIVTVDTADMTGAPKDVLQLVAPHTALDSDRLVTIGWKTDNGQVRIHAGLFLGFLTTAILAIKTMFLQSHHYLGAIYRTRVGDKIATLVATTPEAYVDNIGYRLAVNFAIWVALFDGLFRRGTTSNTANFATPGSTNLLIMNVDGRDYVVPQVPDLESGDTVTRYVDPDGRILQAKVGGNKVFSVNAADLLQSDESIGLAFTTESPIIDIGKPTNFGGFQVTTTTTVLDMSYDDQVSGYVVAKTTEIGSDSDQIDIACMGASIDGSFNFTRRNEEGGKSEIYLVPASEVSDEIAAPWKAASADDLSGFSPSTVTTADPISQDAGAAS